MIPVSIIRSLLHYNPSTGQFTWRERSDVPKEWNARWAGKRAGRLLNTGYWSIKIGAKPYLAHRIAWAYQTGEWPNRLIDHVDQDPSNNRFCNLRQATSAQNQQNSRTPRSNTSGEKGVHWDRASGKWLAYISKGKRYINLGRYVEKQDAIEARARGEREHHEFSSQRLAP